MVLTLCGLALASGIVQAATYSATWTQVSSSAAPGAPLWRGWTAMTWVDSESRIVMWGGSRAVFMNDIVALDPVTAGWSTFEPATNCPGNTMFAPPNGSDENGVAYDPINDAVWIYNGGSGYRCATTQAVGRTAGAGTTTTSIVDPTLTSAVDDYYKHWTVRAPNGAKARIDGYVAATKTLTLSNALNVAAGSAYDLYVDFGDGTWSYSLATGQYDKLQSRHWGYPGYVPPTRRSPGFAADATRAILFGGAASENGTYKLDFATRSYSVAIASGSSSSPAARGQITNQFVYDNVHDRFVLFGGRCFDPARCVYGNMLDDTWIYNANANTWTEVTPAVRPAARNQGQMYFDAANGVVVLYGGSGNSGVLYNDLWTFDLATLTWTQQTMPATNPGGIYLGQVAYAPTTSCGYLVYGLRAGASSSGATWRLCLAPSGGGGNLPPIATFTTTPATALVGTAIAMSAAGSSDPDGSIVGYAWNFGDGTTGSGVNVSKSYATTGTKSVTLTVTDNGGLTASTTRTVTITAANLPPVANFMATPSPTTTGTAVMFSAAASSDPDGTVVGYAWNFGDGTTGSGVTVSKSYATAGTYTVTMTVTDNGGLTASTNAPIVVTAAGGGASTIWVEDGLPTGAGAGGNEPFTWITTNPSPYSGARAHQSGITSGIHQHYFTQATSRLSVGVGDTLFTYVYLDPANPPRTVMLQFYDGSWEHRAFWGANLIPWGGRNMGPLPPAGQWVRLEVAASLINLEGRTLSGMAFTLYDGRATWDYTGKQASGGGTNQPPVASFTTTPASATIGTPIVMSAAGSSDPDGTISAYAWDFGDGTTGSGSSVSKAYAVAGSYTVTLIVTDNGGLTATTTRNVTIAAGNLPPLASFTTTPSSAMTGTPIAMSAAGSSDPDGTIVGYAWNFGDGTTASGVSASKTYLLAGTYTVTLTVTDNGGSTATTTRTVTITAPNQPPAASFTTTPSSAMTGTPIAMSAAGSSDPDGAIVGYAWNFGDGTTASGVSVSKTYVLAGTYTVTLTVTDNGGLSATTTQTVTITTATGGTETVWVEDAIPTGAGTGGNEPFTWITSGPTPFSGTRAHQSALMSGMHQHFFSSAKVALSPALGDRLFAYVYLDPVNPPRQVMLQWNDGSWEHRAYWGQALIPWGGGGGVGGRFMGALPPTGQWVRLEVPAALVGLEGRVIRGMAFTLYDGRATWDRAGKLTP